MSLLTRILLLAKNPAIGIGAVMVILAFVESRGISFSPTTHPSYPLGIFGALVFTFGLIHSLREGPILETDPRFKDTTFYDSSFWHKLFDAMPPAFVKEVGGDNGEEDEGGLPTNKQIAENAALQRFQGPVMPGRPEDEDREIIVADHQRGDAEAVGTGQSRYLESSDTYGINPARQILTLKTPIEHGGKKYVVGWFVAVELPETLGADQTHWARETGGQVTFGLTTESGGDGIRISIGEAPRLALARRASGAPGAAKNPRA
jgi:hypothetical protein